MNKYNSISILGAGGHARSVYSWLLKSNVNFENVQFIDPNKKYEQEMIFNQQILKKDWLDIVSVKSDAFLLGLGNNKLRRYLYEKLKVNMKQIIGIMHNSSVIGYGATIHHVSVIGPHTMIGPEATIGANALINSGAIIEHESIVGHHSHVAPGAKVAGRVQIGDGSFIGIGAVIKENISIGKNVTVGAGAVVINDVPDNAVVVGVPAKIIRFE